MPFALLVLLAGCGSSTKTAPTTTSADPVSTAGATTSTATATTPAATPATPTTTTAQPGPHGPGTGQTVDGIPCESTEQLTYHVHAHLWLLHDGKPEDIPAQTGIIIPAQCIYYLHTHDTTGVIHVEAPAPRAFKLGEFFDIWGEPLSRTSAAGLKGTLHVFVGTRPYTGDPRDIPLKAHQRITIEQGKLVPPPPYTFAAGL